MLNEVNVIKLYTNSYSVFNMGVGGATSMTDKYYLFLSKEISLL